MPTCTRKIEFDYGHRLRNHEAKCAHVHGHRGVLEITCSAESLDNAGRVIDFGEIKRIVGGWVDECWDHAFLANHLDTVMLEFLTDERQKHFVFPGEPSAENMAAFMLDKSKHLLKPLGIDCIRVRFYETPNGWADAGTP